MIEAWKPSSTPFSVTLSRTVSPRVISPGSATEATSACALKAATFAVPVTVCDAGTTSRWPFTAAAWTVAV